jgi:hypothetical protein
MKIVHWVKRKFKDIYNRRLISVGEAVIVINDFTGAAWDSPKMEGRCPIAHRAYLRKYCIAQLVKLWKEKELKIYEKIYEVFALCESSCSIKRIYEGKSCLDDKFEELFFINKYELRKVLKKQKKLFIKDAKLFEQIQSYEGKLTGVLDYDYKEKITANIHICSMASSVRKKRRALVEKNIKVLEVKKQKLSERLYLYFADGKY